MPLKPLQGEQTKTLNEIRKYHVVHGYKIPTAKQLWQMTQELDEQAEGKVVKDELVKVVIKDKSISLKNKELIEKLLERATNAGYIINLKIYPDYIRISEQVEKPP